MHKLSILSSAILGISGSALARLSVWNTDDCSGAPATNWNTYPIGFFDGQVRGCEYFIASSGQAGPPTTFQSLMFDASDAACNLTIYSIANCKDGVALSIEAGECASIPDGSIAAYVRRC
ncbi:hypothetical protein C8A03DRAFT_38139 [Achaetomium macrosporum]|uniref:Uncharacterized protein n=1 Tax=Achaetomium macrosporum TaxID=79813 RepID=A0AAN7C3J4_9PEZI|nr:hypothetical protein C8A03DRAFT_38139 [Achaetomium macrosporum]